MALGYKSGSRALMAQLAALYLMASAKAAQPTPSNGTGVAGRRVFWLTSVGSVYRGGSAVLVPQNDLGGRRALLRASRVVLADSDRRQCDRYVSVWYYPIRGGADSSM